MESESFKTKWVSAVIGKDHYKTEITTDAHKFLVDEPSDIGGTDLAPSPGDFLRTSLASCTAITLRMYIDRKGWNVDKIEVKVHTEEVDDKTIFHTSIDITGEVDPDQRKRLIQIAKKCPIHKLLTNPIDVKTEFV
jgi:putative redox protein